MLDERTFTLRFFGIIANHKPLIAYFYPMKDHDFGGSGVSSFIILFALRHFEESHFLTPKFETPVERYHGSK